MYLVEGTGKQAFLKVEEMGRTGVNESEGNRGTASHESGRDRWHTGSHEESMGCGYLFSWSLERLEVMVSHGKDVRHICPVAAHSIADREVRGSYPTLA